MVELTQKQENFVNNLFKGLTQREAWIQAGYSSKYALGNVDRNACILAGKTKIKQRLEEMRQAAKSDLIADEIERKEILTKVIRNPLIPYEIRAKDTISAIDIVNRMEKIYSDTPPSFQDNRAINIIVIDSETKDLIAQVKERTGKLIEG